MTEKFGLIKNPLTIIAIFAGIAEVSGTVVLPFVSPENQELFIYFLITFPTILVILFFITLNFNNKVLYAPSDYKDETNYIKVNRYDIAKRKNVEIKIPQEESVIGSINKLEIKVDRLKRKLINQNIADQKTDVQSVFLDDEHKYGNLMVSNFSDSQKFVNYMRERGFEFETYYSPGSHSENEFYTNEAIWLGGNVSLKIAKDVIKASKIFYNHLKYIHLTQEDDVPDTNILYIGGSSKSAITMYKCFPLNNSDFEKIQKFSKIEELHSFIKGFKK